MPDRDPKSGQFLPSEEAGAGTTPSVPQHGDHRPTEDGGIEIFTVIDGEGQWASPRQRANQMSRQEHFTKATQALSKREEALVRAMDQMGGNGSSSGRPQPGFGLSQLSGNQPGGSRLGSGPSGVRQVERQSEQPASVTPSREKADPPPPTGDEDDYAQRSSVEALERRLAETEEQNAQLREEVRYKAKLDKDMDWLYGKYPELDTGELEGAYAELSLTEQMEYEGMLPHHQYERLYKSLHGKEATPASGPNLQPGESERMTPYAETERQPGVIPAQTPGPISLADSRDPDKAVEWVRQHNKANPVTQGRPSE